MSDLSKYTLPQLFQLQKDVAKAIDERKVSDKYDTLSALKALAAERGFDLQELLGAAAGKAPKSKSVSEPQYRNPANAENTWTGRGRKPLWVQAHLDAGGQLADLKI